jgi:hypothetical protein
MRAGRRILLTFAAAMTAAAASASAAPMLVMYASPDTNRQIVKPGTEGALPLDGRLYVQEPNVGHLFAGDTDRPYRLSGISGTALLAAGEATAMARLLRSRIDADDCHFAGLGGSHQPQPAEAEVPELHPAGAPRPRRIRAREGDGDPCRASVPGWGHLRRACALLHRPRRGLLDRRRPRQVPQPGT